MYWGNDIKKKNVKIVWIDAQRWRCQEGISILTLSTMLAHIKWFCVYFLSHSLFYFNHLNPYLCNTHTFILLENSVKKGFCIDSKLCFLITISRHFGFHSQAETSPNDTLSHIMRQIRKPLCQYASGGGQPENGTNALVENESRRVYANYYFEPVFGS